MTTKRLLVALATAWLSACGAGEDGRDGTSCTVQERADGTGHELVCADGTTVPLPEGPQGEPGTSCTATENGDGSRTIACEDGTSIVIRDGTDGTDGEDGSDGEDGTSCTVTDNGDGTKTVSCEDGTSVVVADGIDGEDGTSCTLTDNGNGTADLVCTDGSRVTIPLVQCRGDFFAGDFSIGGPWQREGAADVDETTPGHDGRGAGYLRPAAVCAQDTLSQTVCIGGLHERGPLVLSLWQQTDCPGCTQETAVTIGASTVPVALGAASDTWSEARLCVGEAGYGDAIAFALQSRSAPASCDGTGATPGVYFDDVALEEALPLECPAVGEVKNGDFEQRLFGWQIEESGRGLVLLELKPDGNSVLFQALDDCSEATATGLVSVPLPTTLPGAALQLRAAGMSEIDVRFNGASTGSNFTGTGSREVLTACIPDELAGNAVAVQIGLPARRSTNCTSSLPREWVVEEVRLVADPAGCP